MDLVVLSEENKSLVRHIFEELWNKGNLDTVDENISPDYILHSVPPVRIPPTREGLKQFMVASYNAFSERDYKLKDVIAEGDKVATRWSLSGKHIGEFMGLRPTNKQVTFNGISILRIAKGKLVDEWVYSNLPV